MQVNLTISRAYATAIFDLSIENKSFENWKKLLIKLIALSKIRNINQFFNVVYSTKTIFQIIITGCDTIAVDDYAKKFIQLLIINQRLNLLELIFKQFIQLYDKYRNVINIEITTADILNNNQKNSIIISLNKKLNKKINLTYKINPKILYGIILKYDDIVIDDCLASRFCELSNFLIS